MWESANQNVGMKMWESANRNVRISYCNPNVGIPKIPSAYDLKEKYNLLLQNKMVKLSP